MDGSSLLRASYPDLFGKIGTTYGAVDGTHFTLPNLKDTGRFIRSRSGSITVGTSQATRTRRIPTPSPARQRVGTLSTIVAPAHSNASSDPTRPQLTFTQAAAVNQGQRRRRFGGQRSAKPQHRAAPARRLDTYVA
jgi:microcystin-dependent protein